MVFLSQEVIILGTILIFEEMKLKLPPVAVILFLITRSHAVSQMYDSMGYFMKKCIERFEIGSTGGEV
jgi:hypothetical protein